MEYYFLFPVGILLSQKERSKEEVKEILTAAIQSPSESIVSYLAKHRIEKVFTFTAPRFKFKFDIADKQLNEIG